MLARLRRDERQRTERHECGGEEEEALYPRAAPASGDALGRPALRHSCKPRRRNSSRRRASVTLWAGVFTLTSAADSSGWSVVEIIT